MDRSLASEEAQRWLGAAEKLLAARDLLGAKSFAIRVREAFPRLESAADDVVAVADTVLAGETRIGNSGQPQRDWYAVLGLARFTQNLEAVANQYRRLALVLNPHRNRLPFADEAFRLVTDAWSVLSNPSKKAFLDNELAVYSRFDFSAGTQSHHTQTHTHLQEHQFLQRNNHPQPQPQLHHHQQQHHHFFIQNPAPPPPPQQFHPAPPQPQPHAHFQPQQHLQNQQPPPQQQQRQSLAAMRKSPKRKGVVVEEERPNLNNAAESTRPVRPAEVSPPPPRPPLAPQREQTPPLEPEEPEGPTFWTACPFCYILYEYPKLYQDCVLRCQSCKRAFTAVAVLAPPVGAEGDGGPNYFCCWGFFPLGFTGKAGAGAGPGWSPFSPMFAAPVQDQGMGGGCGGGGAGKDNKRKRGGSPRFVYKDDDLFVEISESDGESDCDWRNTRRMNKKSRASKAKVSAARSAKTTAAAGTPSPARVTRSSLSQALASNGAAAAGEKADGLSTKAAAAAAALPAKGEASRKTKAAGTGGKKRGGADWGRLDLNVEFNNDVEEPAGASAAAAATTTTNRGSGVGHGGGGEDDNIEQIGFFEGLDEFLSSLPILNVVGDDKVKAT